MLKITLRTGNTSEDTSEVATPVSCQQWERVFVRIGLFLREINHFANEPKFYVCRTVDTEHTEGFKDNEEKEDT